MIFDETQFYLYDFVDDGRLAVVLDQGLHDIIAVLVTDSTYQCLPVLEVLAQRDHETVELVPYEALDHVGTVLVA